MKKTGILNADISRVIARMGHTDIIAVVDCGYPIPAGVDRIDLSVKPGMPGILDIVRVLADELEVERVIFAAESGSHCPELIQAAAAGFPEARTESIPHAEFKERAKSAAAVIRTGECTPYSNIMLQSGVAFAK